MSNRIPFSSITAGALNELGFEEKPKNPRFQDLTGQEFARLTVLGFAGTEKRRRSVWYCRCSCGNVTKVRAENLKSGHTNSCGCFVVEKNTKHGMHGTRIYHIWENMIARITNPNREGHENYYDKNIGIDKEWRTNPKSFIDWAIENGYKDNLSIDRIDNNRGYYPDNCRFATAGQQMRNTTRNVVFEDECAKDASKRLGGAGGLIRKRIKIGWSLKKAFTTPCIVK